MPPPPLQKQDSLVTPVSTSIVIKLLEELHANLASAIDKYAEWYPVPAPKQPAGAAEPARRRGGVRDLLFRSEFKGRRRRAGQ